MAGRYQLAQKLGEGGMVEVYEGLDSASGARVAVKVVGLDKVRDWKAVELFERGTRLLENLRHAGVLTSEKSLTSPRGSAWHMSA